MCNISLEQQRCYEYALLAEIRTTKRTSATLGKAFIHLDVRLCIVSGQNSNATHLKCN